LTQKAIPGAVTGSNLGKTSIGSYKGFINEKKIKYFFDLAKKIFSFRVVLRLRGIIVAPPLLVQANNFFPQSLIIYAWQFKEATRLRIYNYVKTECG
jgi:hypothetical protein